METNEREAVPLPDTTGQGKHTDEIVHVSSSKTLSGSGLRRS